MTVRSLPAVVLLGMGLMLPLGADAGRSVRKRCFPHGSRTVLKDDVARVYADVYRGQHEIWGCSYRTGHRSFLGFRDFSNSEGEYAAPIMLRRRFVAVNVRESGHDTGTFATVSVFDLRSGKRLHVWSQGGAPCDGYTQVNELALTGSGAAAWIAEAEFGCAPTIKQVFKADGTSRHVKQLDAGPTVDPHYLKLKSGRIYWKHDGARRSAPIR